MELTQGQINDPKAALTFILAGNATVTLRSLKSGNRYTYKIVEAEKRNPNDATTWFVKLLNGPDNSRDFVYIGIIRNNRFSWTSKSRVGREAPSIVGFTYVLDSLVANCTNGFEVWHEGKCGRCGRKLTVPESVASGFGPDCIALLGGVAVPQPSVLMHGTPGDGNTILAQNKLNFDGSVRQAKSNDAARYERIKKFHDSNDDASDAKYLALAAEAGITIEDLEWFSKRQDNDQDYKVKANGVAAPIRNVGDIDTEIRRRVAEYAANDQESYTQDGELDAKQAFNVAYNKFRVQIEQER